MAAPNIVNLTNLRGNTAVLNVSTISSNIIANPASSNKVFKLNTLFISNVDGTNPADVTVNFFRDGIPFAIVSTVTVPADATLVAVSKETVLYVEEGDYIRVQASANNDLHAICSYEEIS
jgi:hypothetical protein